jgi:octopine/nopaline transport system permease protein
MDFSLLGWGDAGWGDEFLRGMLMTLSVRHLRLFAELGLRHHVRRGETCRALSCCGIVGGIIHHRVPGHPGTMLVIYLVFFGGGTVLRYDCKIAVRL